MSFWRRIALPVVFLLAAQDHAAEGAPVVPGTGVVVDVVGDDFEDGSWGYVMNGPKASHEQDEQQRPPGGKSKNGRWYEGAKRGQPDVIRRIATPPGGLPGSACQPSRPLSTSVSGSCGGRGTGGR